MSIFKFELPDVGEGIAEAEIIEWLVSVGDVVRVDQVIAVIETDKSQIEMPTPVAGTISSLNGKPGDVLKVGSVLVEISSESVALPPTPSSGHGTNPVTPAAHVGSSSATSTGSLASANSVGRALASPSTRKLAASLGVDLEQVIATGPGGRATDDDVRKAASHPSLAVNPTQAGSDKTERVVTAGVKVVPLTGLRRSIAASMTNALTIPHILEFKEIDATALLELRDSIIAETGVKISVTPILMKACIVALREHPTLNARYDAQANEVSQYESVHLGIATATDDGLIVPVVHNSQTMNISELSSELDRLADLARTRTATTEQLTGGTFSITNFGSFGTWLGTPVIRPPEVAIAGFGRIADRVIAIDGQAVVRKVLPIVIAVDHRINDGAHLGAFTNTLAQLLASTQQLVGS